VRFAPASAGTVTATLTAIGKNKVTASDALTGTGASAGGSHLYWTDGNAGTVNEANLDGTSPQTIVSGQNGPAAVAA
jgi:hypothetical protein